MAVGLAAVLMPADCAAATMNSPASIARARSSTCQWARPVGTVKAAGTAITSASGLGQPGEQRREAQVVADRQAELPDRRAVDHDRFSPAR